MSELEMDNAIEKDKTIIIFDCPGTGALIFYVVEGDFSHLDGVYIDCGDYDSEYLDNEERLKTLLWSDLECTMPNFVASQKFPIKDVLETNGNVAVIVCGFCY